MAQVLFWLVVMAVMAMAPIAKTHGYINLMCSGGGIRSAYGCSFSLSLLRENSLFSEEAGDQQITNVRGLSGTLFVVIEDSFNNNNNNHHHRRRKRTILNELRLHRWRLGYCNGCSGLQDESIWQTRSGEDQRGGALLCG